MPTPASPAPDHNLPGRLSKRSDGKFRAEGHGTGQQFEAFQAAGAPPSPAVGGGGSGGSVPTPTSPLPSSSDDPYGVFAPMEESPVDPATPSLGSPFPDDPDLALRTLYSLYPHPDILFLLESRESRP